ncbi:MAG: exosortase/archaeosortase family protein [Candidatus Acidiferrum sp.]
MRWLIGSVWLLVSVLLFLTPLRALFALATHSDDASHILLIPFISGWLFYLDRAALQRKEQFDFAAALGFLVPGVALKIFAFYGISLDSSTQLTLQILAFLLLVVAGYIAVLGLDVARRSWFGLAFLLFAVPLPEFMRSRLVYWLQAGSAEVAGWLFEASGVPVLREGFIFRLPRMSIEVAEECSGIRSSIALIILAVLVAHFSFRPFWKKFVFVTAGVLMMLIKNGVRIATLTLLANYVNPGFLYGRLHHQGGVVFFIFGLALLVPLYWWLRRGEMSAAGRPASQAQPAV